MKVKITGKNPSKSLNGSYDIILEIMKNVVKICERDEIITSCDITFNTEKIKENDLPIIETLEDVSDDYLENLTAEELSRIHSLRTYMDANFNKYKGNITKKEFTELAKGFIDISKHISIGSLEQEVFPTEAEIVSGPVKCYMNNIMGKLKIPYIIHENLKGVEWIILCIKSINK